MTWTALRGQHRRLFRGLGLGLAGLAAVALLCGTAVAGDAYEALRREMVEQQVRQHGIIEPDVLAAMGQVQRHLFVPDALRAQAYSDQPLVLGPGRTIYQPYVVALMTQLLKLKRGDKVLEIGTGSGYQAAVLSRIAREVDSIEIVQPVANQAAKLLSTLGYNNVQVHEGNGYLGWPDKAPFDAILLSAAPPSIPKELLQQLRVGGRMVVPVGNLFFQDLLVITKTADGIQKRTVIPVRLSPMKGKVPGGNR